MGGRCGFKDGHVERVELAIFGREESREWGMGSGEWGGGMGGGRGHRCRPWHGGGGG